MTGCKNCKYWNKRKVVQPFNHGMCENAKTKNHKAVLHQDFTCKGFKEGKFRKELEIYLTN